MANINLGNIIDAGLAVRTALDKAVLDPKNSLEKKDVPVVIAAVTAAVDKHVAVAQKEVTSVLDNLQNTEAHWYQKRSRWAAIIAFAAPVLAIIGGYFGITLTPLQFEALADFLTTAGGVVSGVIVLGGSAWSGYLALRAGIATKPLGE